MTTQNDDNTNTSHDDDGHATPPSQKQAPCCSLGCPKLFRRWQNRLESQSTTSRFLRASWIKTKNASTCASTVVTQKNTTTTRTATMQKPPAQHNTGKKQRRASRVPPTIPEACEYPPQERDHDFPIKNFKKDESYEPKIRIERDAVVRMRTWGKRLPESFPSPARVFLDPTCYQKKAAPLPKISRPACLIERTPSAE